MHSRVSNTGSSTLPRLRHPWWWQTLACMNKKISRMVFHLRTCADIIAIWPFSGNCYKEISLQCPALRLWCRGDSHSLHDSFLETSLEKVSLEKSLHLISVLKHGGREPAILTVTGRAPCCLPSLLAGPLRSDKSASKSVSPFRWTRCCTANCPLHTGHSLSQFKAESARVCSSRQCPMTTTWYLWLALHHVTRFPGLET